MNKNSPKELLKKYVKYRTGKLDSNASDTNGKYPFFTCSQDTFKTNTYSFDTEAVILGGNNAAGVFPLKYYKGKFDAYQRTYILETIDSGKLNIRFLYYSLSLELDRLKSQSTGATTKFLTKGIIDNLKIPIPGIKIQDKIVNILSNYDDLIRINKKRILILEKISKLIYEEWFEKFRFPGHENINMVDSEVGKMPENWKIKKFGDFITLNYGKGLKKSERIKGQFPVYGSSGIIDKHNDFLVKGPGIIVGRKGNVGSVFWTFENFFPIDTVYYVTTDISLYYVFYNFKNQNFINNDAAVPGLSRKQAYLLPFLIPDDKTLNSFEANINIIFKQISKLKKINNNLSKTRDLLIPKLINGEIDVSDLDITISEEDA